MAVYVVMTLGAFLCVLWMRDAEGSRSRASPALSGLVADAGPALPRRFAIFMFSLAGIPPLFGFWPKLLVFNAAVASGYVALAVAGILGTVDRRLLLSEDREGHVHGRAGGALCATRASRCRALLILLAALAVSPLGYLLIGPLGALTDRAAGSLF